MDTSAQVHIKRRCNFVERARQGLHFRRKKKYVAGTDHSRKIGTMTQQQVG